MGGEVQIIGREDSNVIFGLFGDSRDDRGNFSIISGKRSGRRKVDNDEIGFAVGEDSAVFFKVILHVGSLRDANLREEERRPRNPGGGIHRLNNHVAIRATIKKVIKSILQLCDEEERPLLVGQLSKRIIIRVRNNNRRLSSFNHQLQFLELRLVFGNTSSTDHLIFAKHKPRLQKQHNNFRRSLASQRERGSGSLVRTTQFDKIVSNIIGRNAVRMPSSSLGHKPIRFRPNKNRNRVRLRSGNNNNRKSHQTQQR
mmetsp:Transcript_34968/g.54503  ORF Transcript_34968/g.54503 Transcript_34968/m.54503 type:complete len:256 (+) Transcript_34968:386-1153(+)